MRNRLSEGGTRCLHNGGAWASRKSLGDQGRISWLSSKSLRRQGREASHEQCWIYCRDWPLANSLLSSRDPTFSEELAQLLVGAAAVGHMLLTTAAPARAFTLEGPREANFLASVLGDSNVASIHHGRDGIKLRVAEPSHEVLVSTGVDGGYQSCGTASR